jgi:hypothetical protein
MAKNCPVLSSAWDVSYKKLLFFQSACVKPVGVAKYHLILSYTVSAEITIFFSRTKNIA